MSDIVAGDIKFCIIMVHLSLILAWVSTQPFWFAFATIFWLVMLVGRIFR